MNWYIDTLWLGYCSSANWPEMRLCCHRSVVRRPSRNHISKTKQDRPLVNIKHHKKLVLLILLPHLDPPLYDPGDILISNACRRPSFLIRSVVISRKRSKTDPWLIRSTT